MRVESVSVSSLGQLITEVVELRRTWSPWFRGQECACWNLEPKVQRNVRRLGITDSTYEKNLTHRFRGRAQIYVPTIPFEKTAAWLQTMQHHRLPTRLLDWSRSPLVACYFAIEHALGTVAAPERDAAVWALEPHWLNSTATDGVFAVMPGIESGMARALVDGAFYGDEWARERAQSREREWATAGITSSGQGAADCMAVMASESDLRMVVQQGAFTVHRANIAPLNTDPRFIPCLRKYVIKAESLPEVAREVEACGLSEGGIYPDLDNLSRELERTQEDVGARTIS